jgi:hypothetical protein
LVLPTFFQAVAGVLDEVTTCNDLERCSKIFDFDLLLQRIYLFLLQSNKM